VVGRVTMNPGIDPYCRAFGGPRPMNFMRGRPASCFCPRGGKYRLQGPRDGTKGVGRGETYLSMKIVSRARRSPRDSNRREPSFFEIRTLCNCRNVQKNYPCVRDSVTAVPTHFCPILDFRIHLHHTTSEANFAGASVPLPTL
jgi:hypothetical protein